ncbi:DNA-binding MarR family transcriptional regulator [Variovorax boronicumulans]|uniref:MarR family winged helix-turn-helix transcriptional regulator n=1 Tax=Variovorax boronicumulans TaxID=436515 RepID=UPI00247475CA|nr:MarR family transcriptional regulator [Variovorax boronicumulans]MDH6167922.1 DNA-binding MarR family transcriptional regulator [Variovorax boronicumulans]
MQAFPDTTALRAPRALDDLLLFRLWRATRTSRAMATRIVEGGFGITHREWGMIGMLAQIGETRPSALAEQLQLDRVRTSRGLRSLFEKQLIERRQNADDGREVHVQLSDAGWQLFEDLFPRMADLNVDLLKGLDAEHHEIFLDCLYRLESRGNVLNARQVVPEKADRRSGGTRHHWPRHTSMA